MELKEFIKAALSDIVAGVREAGNDLKGDVAMCYHTNKAYNGYPSVSYEWQMKEKQAPMTVVDFKVRVEVIEGEATDKGASASLLNVVGAGAHVERTQSNATMQELSFSVPMVWLEK